tara:strand:- start:125 stop:445 length:321 start_codon:yes stop_codon:yes gene_type:complete
MGLFVEFEVTNINTMVIDLPNDYDLIENDILEDSDLPKNWQNKEEFTISDLKKQSEEYQEYVMKQIYIGIECNSFNEFEDYSENNTYEQIRDIEILDYDLDIEGVK